MNYREDADFTEKIDIHTASDTLYVKLHDDLQGAYTWGKNDNELYTLDGNPRSWFIFPKIRVNQDTIYKNFEIKIKKTAFDKSYQAARAKATNAKFNYNIQDSLVLLKPYLYNRDNPWNREIFEIEINSPANKTVIIDEPINYRHHYFDNWDND